MQLNKTNLLADKRGLSYPIDDLSNCINEGESCSSWYGANMKPCCDGLECIGIPFTKCEKPEGTMFYTSINDYVTTKLSRKIISKMILKW